MRSAFFSRQRRFESTLPTSLGKKFDEFVCITQFSLPMTEKLTTIRAYPLSSAVTRLNDPLGQLATGDSFVKRSSWQGFSISIGTCNGLGCGDDRVAGSATIAKVQVRYNEAGSTRYFCHASENCDAHFHFRQRRKSAVVTTNPSAHFACC